MSFALLEPSPEQKRIRRLAEPVLLRRSLKALDAALALLEKASKKASDFEALIGGWCATRQFTPGAVNPRLWGAWTLACGTQVCSTSYIEGAAHLFDSMKEQLEERLAELEGRAEA